MVDMKATHRITACYFPSVGEADLTWEDINTHMTAAMTVKVTPEQGNQLAEVVPACVFWEGAALGLTEEAFVKACHAVEVPVGMAVRLWEKLARTGGGA